VLLVISQIPFMQNYAYWSVGGVCFNFSALLWISFREIQKLDGPESEKLRSSWKVASSFSLLGHPVFEFPKS
jgi:hypothetical protein